MSVTRVVLQRRRLRCVLSVLDSAARDGLSDCCRLELGVQWGTVVAAGPCVHFVGLIWPSLLISVYQYQVPVFGLCMIALMLFFIVLSYIVTMLLFEVGVLGFQEDPQVHPFRWLGPDLVAPAPFLSCDPRLTEDGSGILSDLERIDEQFRKVWLPFLCRACRGSVDLPAFNTEAGGWLPRLDEVDSPSPLFSLPPPSSGLSFMMSFSVRNLLLVALMVGGWRDLKAISVSWFDWFAVIFSRIELDGVWPDGLLDAYIAMSPKADGDATPIGQHPLCVLPVVYRLWASVVFGHLLGFVIWVHVDQISQRPTRCSTKGWTPSSSPGKRAFGALCCL